MRKSFLTKAVVAVGVMVSAMALSSVCAWAASGSWDFTTQNATSTVQNLEDNKFEDGDLSITALDSKDGYKNSVLWMNGAGSTSKRLITIKNCAKYDKITVGYSIGGGR